MNNQRTSLSSFKWLGAPSALIVLVNIAVFLDIPILRPILGLIFLTFLPGLLIIFFLKLDKLGIAEKLVLMVGSSVAFVLFFGLLLNQGCLLFGYTAPLSTLTLMPYLSIAMVILLVASYFRNREAFSSAPFQLSLNTKAKWCLLLPCLFPFLAIVGTHLLNVSDNNLITLTLLFLIPVSIILLTYLRREISPDTYPIAIIMIAVSLLIMFWLRSEHILGHDVHQEFRLAHMTLLNGHWGIVENTVLDSCLSINLLPAIYQSVINLAGEEYLFKGIFVLICTFTPLSVYIISRRYVGELFAFLAAIFLMCQTVFLSVPGSPRNNLAIFFFAMCVMLLFHQQVSEAQRKGLLIAFMAATIVSHYTTTYLFFLLLFFTYIISLVLKRYVSPRKLNLTMVGLFLAMIFLWYAQLTQASFIQGVGFFDWTMKNLYLSFFAEEARASEVTTLLGSGVAEKILLGKINYVINLTTFAFIAVGVIGTLLKHRSTLAYPQQRSSPSGFLSARFDTEYFLLALACCALLVATVALPLFSTAYGVLRVYSQVMAILAVFFLVGGMILAKYLRVASHWLILLVLIPYFLFSTNVIYEVCGVHNNMILSSQAPSYDYEIVHPQEVESATWLKEHTGENPRFCVADGSGHFKLISQGKFSKRQITECDFREQSEINGYLYLSYYNVVDGKLGDWHHSPYNISDYTDTLESNNKIYANGGSEIYR